MYHSVHFIWHKNDKNKPKHSQNYVALRKDVINMCRRPEIRTCTTFVSL